MDNVLSEPKGDKIILSDGKEYELAPVDLNLLAELEDKFNEPFVELFQANKAIFVRFLIYLRLKNNYPEIDSEEKAGSLVTADVLLNIGKIYGI